MSSKLLLLTLAFIVLGCGVKKDPTFPGQDEDRFIKSFMKKSEEEKKKKKQNQQ